MSAGEIRAGVGDISVNGLRTRVAIEGTGIPLLLIAGVWGGVSAWRPLTAHLTGFRTIAFDAPGIGGTDLPPYPMPLPALAGFAAAVLREVGERRAHVLGVSFGGLVARQLAVLAPDRVDRLVLASTPAGLLPVPGRLRDLGEVFGGRIRDEPGLVTELGLWPPPSPAALLGRLNGLAGWWGVPWLPPHPTLVLTGDDDPLVPASNSRVLAACLPDARLRVVRGGGHLVVFDSPERVAPVVAAFLRRPDVRADRLGTLAS